MPVTAPHRPSSAGSSRRQPFLTAATTPDAALVELAAAGDERAFEILFQRHRTDVLAYATRMLRDHGRAEDVVQDVFVSAMRAILGAAPEDQPAHVRAWLREIARRTCIDQWRGTTRRGEVSLDAPERLRPTDADRLADDDSLARTTDGREAVATLRLAFGDLPELQHAVLVQRELEGRSIAEIAARLDVTPTVVEGQLARGRRALGQAYKELESGQRCVSVRALCDASLGGRLGVRDRHRVGRHVQGCDSCRRYAREAGVDSRLVDRQLLSRATLLLPLPLLRRLPLGPTGAGDAAGSVLGAKALVGAAVLAAGSGGVYVARVAPPTPASASASSGDGRTAPTPTNPRTGVDGRPLLRVPAPGARTTTARPPGVASPVGTRGIVLFLPPWMAKAGKVSDLPGASRPSVRRPHVADPGTVVSPVAPAPPAPAPGPSRGTPADGPSTSDRTAPLTPTAPAAPGPADTTSSDDVPPASTPASVAGAAGVSSDDAPASSDAPVVADPPAATPDDSAADASAPDSDAPVADEPAAAGQPAADTATSALAALAPAADAARDASTAAPDGGAAGGD